VSLNVLGWFGTSIVGTLHTFYPSLVNERLAWPRLERVVFALWTLGVLLLAGGLATLENLPAAGGLLALLAASILLVANLAATAQPSAVRNSLATMLVSAGQLLLPAALALGAVSVISEGAHGLVASNGAEALRILVIVGWIGFTLGGSLLHLTSLLARVRSRFTFRSPESPGPSGPALVTTAFAGVVVLALAAIPDAGIPSAMGLLLVLPAALVLAGRIALNLRRAIPGAAPPPGPAAA
jgi:hypothetical protein